MVAQRGDADGDAEAADPPAEALRPLPRPHHVPHPLGAGRGDRLWRPRAGRGRARVPEFPGDAGVREGPRALRPVRGAGGVRQRGYALVVEGYMDVVALAQSGFRNAVATLGTACTAEHVQKLFRFTDAVVFSFDGDGAGRVPPAARSRPRLPHASDTRTSASFSCRRSTTPTAMCATRRGGVRAAHRRRRAAVEQMIAEACEGLRLRHRRRPGALPGECPAALDRLARGHAEAPASGRDRPPGGARRRGAGGALAGRPGGARPPGAARGRPNRPVRAAAAGAPGDSPAARPGRLDLLLESAWWEELVAADHALLCALPGCTARPFASSTAKAAEHGRQSWAVLRERIATEPWGEAALALVDGEDPAIEPSLEDLRSSMAQLRGGRRRNGPRPRSSGRPDERNIELARSTPVEENRGIILCFRDHGE